MKLKPLHIILVVVFLLEAVLLGFVIAKRHNTSGDNTAKNCVVVPVTYEANKDETYQLLSIFDKDTAPSFTFTHDEQEYSFTGDAAAFINCFKDKKAFAETYPALNESAWEAYRTAATQIAYDTVSREHTSLDYIKKVANGWYGVQDDLMSGNLGFYTLNLTTTINAWSEAFPGIRPTSDGKIINEVALPAVVRIGDEGKDYNAMIFMVVADDGNSENNATAKEVIINVLFGDELMSDFKNQPIHIYTMDAAGTQYLAYMTVKTSFSAQMMESRYRDILS